MVEVARRMRWEPWLLQDTELIRDMARPADKRVASLPPTPARLLETCSTVPRATVGLVLS